MSPSLVIGLVWMAAVLGGCATYDAPSKGGSASPGVTAPAPGPANVFGPESNHYFGTGGP